MDSGMRILPIAFTPHVATVAAWLHAEWWAEDGWKLEDTIRFLREAEGPAAPCCFVAEEEGCPLGTATFDTEDLPSRRDLSPWLASVLVAPAHRRRGVASALVAHVEQAARRQGHRRLWLFTGDCAPFYAARGWAKAGMEEWRGRPVTLMAKDLA